jgi:hypothetical protein
MVGAETTHVDRILPRPPRFLGAVRLQGLSIFREASFPRKLSKAVSPNAVVDDNPYQNGGENDKPQNIGRPVRAIGNESHAGQYLRAADSTTASARLYCRVTMS